MTSVDFTGRVFGNLTVIRRVESKVREAKWFCLCLCGRNCIVATSKFKRGQHCCTECTRKNRVAPANFVDLIGQRFGSLVVAKRGDDDKNGHLRWQCKCDCGNEIVISTGQLKIQKNCRQCWSPVTTVGNEKHCSRCKTWKTLDSFPKAKTTSGRGAYCYTCYKQYKSEWMRKKFYGITDEEFGKAIAEHDGRCAICDRYEELVIDHCHKTGKFRGLICRLCNSMLGRFKDNQALLHRAIKYLNQYQDEPVHSST